MEDDHENYFPSKNFTCENSNLDSTQTKEAIIETFNKLRKWREEQLAHFRSMQLIDAEREMSSSEGPQKQSDDADKHHTHDLGAGDYLKKDFCNVNVSATAENNDISDLNTLQESSITGHLQRCFGDSAQSSPSAPENKVAFEVINPPLLSGIQGGKFSEKILNAGKDKKAKNADRNSAESKPKRPFLKKGTGLLRFQPKSSRPTFNRVPANPYSSSQQSTLGVPPSAPKLKPALRTTSVPPEQIKHIRFDIPNDEAEIKEELECRPFPCLSNKTDDNLPRSYPNAESFRYADDRSAEETKDQLNTKENLNLSDEKKELEEFELLENIAQNSSFNSDSSLIQRVLHGENILGQRNESKRPTATQENLNRASTAKPAFEASESLISSAKIGLSKCLEEVHARKEIVQKNISDINPRIQSLQKEVARFNDDILNTSDQSDRCSSPVDNYPPENRDLPAIPETSALDDPRLSMEIEDDLCSLNCKSCSIGNQKVVHHRPLAEIDSSVDSSPENDRAMSDKLRIREKIDELEQEIEIYQEHNKRLASICKERDEILRKLHKEREDFKKYKEAEKKKLETEMQEQRKQIKRQKDTFVRYQKLRKDNPTRKEREELNSLRQEVEKLQEELKRHKIKHNSDCRRLRNQLESAERERDTLKLENIRLEEQVQDLLTALKVRLKNNPETLLKPVEQPNRNITNNAESSDEVVSNNAVTEEPASINKPTQSKKSAIPPVKATVPKESGSKKETNKIRFGLSDGSNPLLNAGSEPDSESCDQAPSKANVVDVQDSTPAKPPGNGFASDLSEPASEPETNSESELQKLKNCVPSNLSTISVTIEAECRELNHGNKVERIYSSGEREIIFNSGTRKFIGTDGKIRIMYFNGDRKEVFPDGREVYTYVNGMVEKHFPNGLEVTEFPSGQIQRCYPDGKKEVKFPDGTMHNLFADGSEEIKAADGNVVQLGPDGTEIILLANGQKEIRTATYKRREFPDGSTKIIYASGRQETRYSDGRIKIKDKEGKLVFDTKYMKSQSQF